MNEGTEQIIGENIRIWLIINHDSIEKMAVNLNMSRTTLTNLRAGRSRMVRFSTLEAIANYFKTTVAELVTPHHLGVF